MNHIKIILIAILLLMGLSLYLSLTRDRDRFQYYVTAIPDEEFVMELDKYGKDGWEVIFARRASDGDKKEPTMMYEVILKKKK